MHEMSKLNCSVCGKLWNGGYECMGCLVCRACATDDTCDRVLAFVMRERGLIDDNGKPTEKAEALAWDRIYDDEGTVRPHGTCDA